VCPQSSSCVADTGVLRYFLFVDRFELLLRLLGEPIAVPRIVFDPDEGAVPEAAMSEITRSIAYQRRKSLDQSRLGNERQLAERNAERLSLIHELVERRAIEVVDLTDSERTIVGHLTNPERVQEYHLIFALDPGEAACVAIGVERGWTIATDDGDAIKALHELRPRHPYQRIRKLLRTAADETLIGRDLANAIHAEMRELGFWDNQPPFPGIGT